MNLAQLYKKQSVTTASPKAVILQLHDKMLREMDQATAALKMSEISAMREHIQNVQNIVAHILGSIDMDLAAGQPLYNVYRYYLLRLSEVFIQPNDEGLEELRGYFQSWRETWLHSKVNIAEAAE